MTFLSFVMKKLSQNKKICYSVFDSSNRFHGAFPRNKAGKEMALKYIAKQGKRKIKKLGLKLI